MFSPPQGKVSKTRWFTTTISQNASSVVVTHSLGKVPSGYSIYPKDQYCSGGWVSAEDISTCTISLPGNVPVESTLQVGVIP